MATASLLTDLSGSNSTAKNLTQTKWPIRWRIGFFRFVTADAETQAAAPREGEVVACGRLRYHQKRKAGALLCCYFGQQVFCATQGVSFWHGLFVLRGL
ncbi:hypothetical protein [Fuerstiella marisgermanici]|uniref:Uncharacterized protein n=1 Tax=Fuerstiella marisgermanici TaxID=1891926 RepID=A0A1P8WCB1_9PLAN|nr:hypothetical protein [Fuerstiella marisgermanici]APZ91673.1 hypothetical protein Fuma_01264 [Fuerstiella marisgermanici]